MKDRQLTELLALGDGEGLFLALAYHQMMVVKVLLYFATEKGSRGFVPVPAMIASSIVKAVYEHAYGIKPRFLPQDRLLDYPKEIFSEGFWWDRDTVYSAQKEMVAVRNIPEAMRAIVETLISECSVLHPKGLLGIKMASWWPARPCGPREENLFVSLTEENKQEAEHVLMRLGDENAAWCETIGVIMVGCMG